MKNGMIVLVFLIFSKTHEMEAKSLKYSFIDKLSSIFSKTSERLKDAFRIFKRSAESSSDANSGSSSGTISKSAGSSDSYAKTKIKTKIRASSNAKSNSSAASRAKAFAKTNTDTKIKTNIGTMDNKKKPPPGESLLQSTTPFPINSPHQTTQTTVPPSFTRPTHAYWSPSFGTTPYPNEVTPMGQSENSNVTISPFEHEKTKIICVSCPVPCPVPYACPCPCAATPATNNFIYCPAQCAQAPTPQVIAIPQQINTLPCTDATSPCYVDTNVCYCNGAACPCKRMLQRRISARNIDLNENVNNPSNQNDSHSIFLHAVVAADHVKCSEIGKDIFKKGGNSMDAIIATHMCVEVVNGHSTGIGGGGFLVAYNKKRNELFTIDFRETLPKNYNDEKNMTQGDTILVPGVLRGLEMGHKKMGKLPWKELFQGAIKIAREGFVVHEALAEAIAKKKNHILANLGMREVYAPDGFLLRTGQILKREKLADTFEKIAKSGGSDIFYRGEMAIDIVNDIKEAGGSMNLGDLKEYEPIVREPLVTDVAGLKLIGVKPPASSVIVATMLKIMEKFKWSPQILKKKPGLFYHQMVEAMKFAFSPASFLGDPKFTNKDDDIVKYMLNETVIRSLFKKIDKRSHRVEYYGSYNGKSPVTHGTSHMSAVGPEGDSVSLTSSINAHFGSRFLSRRLGLIYNNQISDFSEFWPRVYNFSADKRLPKKRPMSKVSPLIFLDSVGNVQISIGAAGGAFIPAALSSTLANYLFLHDNISIAIQRPRIHCQLFPPTVVVEDIFPSSIRPLLNQYGHKFVTNDTYSVSGQSHAIMGVIQGIVRNKDGSYEAASDYRKGGLPAGY